MILTSSGGLLRTPSPRLVMEEFFRQHYLKAEKKKLSSHYLLPNSITHQSTALERSV